MKNIFRKLLFYLLKKLGMAYTVADHRELTRYLVEDIFVGYGNITNILSDYNHLPQGKLYFTLTLESGGNLTIFFELRGPNVKFNFFGAEHLNLEYDSFLKICHDIKYYYTLDDDKRIIVENSVKNLLR